MNNKLAFKTSVARLTICVSINQNMYMVQSKQVTWQSYGLGPLMNKYYPSAFDRHVLEGADDRCAAFHGQHKATTNIADVE
jgi:hypothetical protein